MPPVLSFTAWIRCAPGPERGKRSLMFESWTAYRLTSVNGCFT